MSVRYFCSSSLTKIAAKAGVPGAIAICCWAGLSSCKREEKERQVSTAEAAQPAPAGTKSLSPAALDAAGKGCVLVKIPGQSDVAGVLLEGAEAMTAKREYLVLCAAPGNLDATYIAYQAAGGVEKASAKRTGTLPSGLSVYQFTAKSKLSFSRAGDSVAGEVLHAISLTGAGSITNDERAVLVSELEGIREQKKLAQQKITEAMRPPRSRPGGDPRANMPRPANPTGPEVTAIREELKDLSARESLLGGRVQFPINSLSLTEIAAGAELEGMEQKKRVPANALLTTPAGAIRSIHYQGKWVDVKEALKSASKQIGAVKLQVRGSNNSVNVVCEFAAPPGSGQGYSAVMATTFGLESQGSGTAEQRLATVTPVPFQIQGAKRSINQRLKWNGRKSTLWLKVFSDDEPAKLILDEVILLDYPGTFSARWGKPPTPLIGLGDAKPDEPEDLVGERSVLDAKGNIRDLVAAGDGSVAMVQTDRPPFWAALDLKSGQWLDVPWKATAETLVATQAGKIYLIDRHTKILEIWNLASGKREGMQLLPADGTIIAAAAPLSEPAQPLMIVTDKEGLLLDPVKFEVIPSGLNVAPCLAAEQDNRSALPPLDPATVWVRASHDGAIYTLSGARARATTNPTITTVPFTVDRTSMALPLDSSGSLLPSVGRHRTRFFPDHGGSDLCVNPSSGSGEFPGSPGQLRFADDDHGQEIATWHNPPLYPQEPDKPGGYLLPDRGVYFDSSRGVVLMPDGDKLNFARVNLPPQDKCVPEFLFSGESFEIPLPAGSGHKLESSIGGEMVTATSSIKWTVPPARNESAARLKLEWTGELGTSLTKDFQVKVINESRVPLVVSTDGKKQRPLVRRGILDFTGREPRGFAGSGQVILTNDSGQLFAWNLVTCEMLFSRKGYAKWFFGDADNLYVFQEKGTLSSFDLRTGDPLAEVELGKSIVGLTTGIASRQPLLAVERETQSYLMEIQRDTLKTKITDFPKDIQSLFFVPNFTTNPSGSITWSYNAMIARDKKAITARGCPNDYLTGVPDASGRFIVSDSEIQDIGVTPSKKIKISSLPGVDEAAKCKLDESGRYLLIWKQENNSTVQPASVRDIQAPSRELFKLVYPLADYHLPPIIVSGSNTLLNSLGLRSGSASGVYEFNVPAIVDEFSR